MPYLQPSTWRLLGLNVAAGYTAFGLFEMLVPAKAGKELFGIEPEKNAEVDEVVELLTPLMGARDLSIAAALFYFHHTRGDKEMGALIVAGTFLCLADVVAIGFRQGFRSAAFVAGGASFWTAVGLGLMADMA